MNINGVADVMAVRDAILQRNASLREAAAKPAVDSVGQSDRAIASSNFAATMKTAIDKVNALQVQEDVATEAYERGETTDIATVVLMQQRASVSFEATLQVRNKVLSAYKDIMSMAI